MKNITNLTKASVFLFALFLSISAAKAQPVGVHFGGNFMLGSPQGDFKENINQQGYGGSAFAAYQIPGSFLQVGLELGGMIYGHEVRNAPFSTTIPDVYVDVTTQNIFVTGHSFFRIQLPNGFFRPYVDGLLGFNHLFTETSISDEDWDDDYGSAAFSSTHASDTGLSYGVGGGTMIQLFSTRTEEGLPFNIYLDLRARMLNGSSVDYLKEGSIRVLDDGIEYDTQRSKTDAIFFQAGLAFRF